MTESSLVQVAKEHVAVTERKITDPTVMIGLCHRVHGPRCIKLPIAIERDRRALEDVGDVHPAALVSRPGFSLRTPRAAGTQSRRIYNPRFNAFPAVVTGTIRKERLRRSRRLPGPEFQGHRILR